MAFFSDTDDYARVAMPTDRDETHQNATGGDSSDVESVVEDEDPQADGMSIGFADLI